MGRARPDLGSGRDQGTSITPRRGARRESRAPNHRVRRLDAFGMTSDRCHELVAPKGKERGFGSGRRASRARDANFGDSIERLTECS
jgi:hypothetical protein